MFRQRVFASSSIPRSMFSTLNLNSQKQAQRMLPAFTVCCSSFCTSSFAVIQNQRTALNGVLSDPLLNAEALVDLLDIAATVPFSFSQLFELWGSVPSRL
mmetsp:Transcript_52802/g.60672  ORF Transcript_52802/g.60672 Transcript_52802/m.60672 type:complete len:100 (-) Transcript_52802:41-340(-)